MMPWVHQPPAAIDWSQFLPRVSLAGLTPTVELRYADSPWGGLVVVSRWVDDVNGGTVFRLGRVEYNTSSPRRWISAAYPLPAVTTVDDAMGWLYRLVSGNLGHEVLEHMKIDGKVWRNPHAG